MPSTGNQSQRKNNFLRWIENHPVLFWLSLIVLTGAFLRFWDLGSESIWLDEAWSIMESQMTIQGIANHANQPPLYFLALRGWIFLFGTSEVATRSLSAIFGIASVAAIYLAGTSLYNKKAGLFAAFLSSIGYFPILYSQEARGYSLLLLLSALSYWFFIQILKSGKNKWYFAYTIASFLMLYTHFYSVLIVASQILFYLIYLSKYPGQRRRYLIPIAILGISIVLLFLLMQNKIFAIAEYGFWIKTPGILNLGNTAAAFSGYGPTRYAVLAIFAVSGIIGIFGSEYSRKPENTVKLSLKLEFPEKTVLLLLWLAVPIIISFIESQFMTPTYQSRYLIGTYPAMIILIANGINKIKPKWIITAVLLVITALSSLGLYNYYKNPEKPQWRETAAFIEAHSQPGDIIIVSLEYQIVSLKYYYSGNLVSQGIPTLEKAEQFINSPESTILRDEGRLWLTYSRGSAEVYDYFADFYGQDTIILTQKYHGINIVLFYPSGN